MTADRASVPSSRRALAETEPGEAAVAPALGLVSPQAVLALQGTAGNAAVSAYVARLRHGALIARAAPAPAAAPVPRTPTPG